MQELTLLFYIASDNALAPLVVSEIKAIKDAGFQKDTTVLVYFDPMEKGAPTQLLNVNSKRKNEKGPMGIKTSIGDGEDPFVRNMSEDEITEPEDLTPEMQDALKKSGTITAVESLSAFIQFALEKHEAENYMLFTLGHGMIVANDAFLPDDNPVSSVTLQQLKKLCELFTKNNKTSLRLLGLHSCSMSSVEVAYQLKGKADYMLATQGTMFVNGWPYRQLLKKTLKHVDRAKQEVGGDGVVNYDVLIRKLYFLCLFNFTDFMTAGYSCDLSLINLSPAKLDALKDPLQRLVAELKEGLDTPGSLVKDLVLLAHWEAQSFWSENYTDLWDFCDCLKRRCKVMASSLRDIGGNDVTTKKLEHIDDLCQLVKDVLAPEDRANRRKGVVRNSDNCGSEFQYARGLSIYFPWCEPLDDRRATFKSDQDDVQADQREAKSKTVLENYKNYDFTTDFEPSWHTLLLAYFKDTMREARRNPGSVFNGDTDNLKLSPDEARRAYERAEKTFIAGVLKKTPELKKTPDVGGDCTCPTIKNYPISRFPEDSVSGESERIIRQFSMTRGALKAFLPIGDQEEREDE